MTTPAAPRPLRRIVLGLTGGIAAYKAAELTRLLMKQGIAVDIVMTPAATQFITPMTLQALSGHPVLTDLWQSGAANAMGHIDLSRGADAILVAPASADFIAKLAHGRADDLLSTLCLARECPLLTAGPTFEAIDPVRGITNLSSGKMGFALAQACAEAGAEVTLIAGPTTLSTPAGVTRIDVKSAADMANAVESHVKASDIFVAVAAVADYTPAEPHKQKVKKSAQPLTLTLKPTIDILAAVASRPKPPFCVGFAAETNDVNENAEAKRRRKKVPLLVAKIAERLPKR